MSKFKAVIWDYGNVLSLTQPQSAIDQMRDIIGISDQAFEKEYWAERLQYDRGDFDGLIYWQRIGERGGRELTEATCRQLIDIDNKSWSHPNEASVRFAKVLHEQGIKLAILSNMPSDFRQYLASGCRWLPSFTQHTYSCEVRAVKPDKAIYEYCLQGLGLRAHECVFADDREPNIEAARKLGIEAVHFVETKAALSQLAELFETAVPVI